MADGEVQDDAEQDVEDSPLTSPPPRTPSHTPTASTRRARHAAQSLSPSGLPVTVLQPISPSSVRFSFRLTIPVSYVYDALEDEDMDVGEENEQDEEPEETKMIEPSDNGSSWSDDESVYDEDEDEALMGATVVGSRVPSSPSSASFSPAVQLPQSPAGFHQPPFSPTPITTPPSMPSHT
ncbi:hypothetical protein I204_08542 [Kwoniella mangroviensis CBS 8886]|nr:hypothetical protein I204_08542 [Kwoniella mangroviensis CBS 8886]